MIIDFNVSFRPVLSATFKECSNILTITLANGKSYEYNLSKKQFCDKEKPPKKLISSMFDDAYFGPYGAIYHESNLKVWPIMNDTFSINTSPNKWMNTLRMYCSNSHLIYYIDGDFYLNGTNEGIFAHKDFNFQTSHQIEKLRDSSWIYSYLREKNDLFNICYESEDARYVILVSRMLNSIIVFDTKNLIILDAYKHSCDIIGCRLLDNNTIELVSNSSPYHCQFKVNLPQE
jgi:hypothetical protein